MMLTKKNSEALEHFGEKLEVEGRSLWQDARRRFVHNRAAVSSLFVLGLITLFVIVAPWLSQFAYDDTDWAMMSAAPSLESAHYFGTDSSGRDLLVRVAIGGRISLMVGVAAALVAVIVGTLYGAMSGYLGGKTDLAFQRFIEIWGSMPELYLLIIFSAIFAPSVALLLVLLSLFGWMGLSDYVRAEFLRNRQLDYVRGARALGVSNLQIIWRHILPNSMVPVVTFLPFRMSAAILALTSLDFLGLGVPAGTPSLGELLNQGKANVDAWWISLSTFAVLVVTLLLLTFMGDALRDALDPRKADVGPKADDALAPAPSDGSLMVSTR